MEVNARVKSELERARGHMLRFVAEETEWLRMWIQRRVDVERSTTRALPLILDDVERAHARLCSALRGVSLDPEQVVSSSINPHKELDIVGDGDVSLYLCFRTGISEDHDRLHVFNYTANAAPASHTSETRQLVTRLLHLLQLNPAQDARMKAWQLTADHKRPVGSLAQGVLQRPPSRGVAVKPLQQ